MKSIFHAADTRGFADHGWLKTNHTFSFANYYNPNRVQFGALRVLNDDNIAAGMGFGTHPHRDMEIITIPLRGDLAHKDSMGNASVIKHGEVQVMSAGTGVQHSEFNHNKDSEVELLQIWVLPRQTGVTPRYQQIKLNPADRKNKLQQILSPNVEDPGVWIHQDAWFSLGELDADFATTYSMHRSGNGLYAFLISGSATIAGQTLQTRDGMGIWETDNFDIQAISPSTLLLMEVPM